jgi:hypothetical protein
MPLPGFNQDGDLPIGIHRVLLSEVLQRFGTVSPQRKRIAGRLERIYRLALSTGQLARFIVFGSFITSEENPNDVDVFMLMKDSFDLSKIISGEVYLLFSDHSAAQARFGASVFWLRRQAALGGGKRVLEDWEIKRDGGKRGIVEIVEELP